MVIPTYNAGHSIGKTLDCLAAFKHVIISDAGSSDETRHIATDHGATVIQKAKGRGAQLKAGSEAATTDWLLFLHADTLLDQQAIDAVFQFINTPENQQRAGYFRFKLNDHSPQAARLENIVAWRCRKHTLPYGDQGLLIHRDLLDELGGYKTIPIMEDVDWCAESPKRMGKRRSSILKLMPLPEQTSFNETVIDGVQQRTCFVCFYSG